MSKSRSRLAADWMGRLTVNEDTQEVEHEVINSVKAGAEATAAVVANGVYSSAEIDTMFDEVIAEVETIAVQEGSE